MTEQSALTSNLLGRLDWNAIPFHEPILLYTFFAVAAGGIERSPVIEHTHETVGPRPIKRMLQGGVTDPFGHMWLIGKFLG